MSANWGTFYRLSIFGEARSGAVGIVIDGLPPGLPLDDGLIWRDMARRTPGTSPLAPLKREADLVRVVSGLYNGKTQGTPLCAMIEGEAGAAADMADYSDTPRPGHADFAARERFGGFADPRGGGHLSGRLTAPLVFAGAVARIALARIGVHAGGHLKSIGHVTDAGFDPVDVHPLLLDELHALPIPTLDADAAQQMGECVAGIKSEGDSLGGVLEIAAIGLPTGMGAPFFQSLESSIASLLFSIPGVKGVEFGDGFALAAVRGSDASDAFTVERGEVRTQTNHNGGLLGGISTGMPLIVRAAVKPTPAISKPQTTVRLSSMTSETISGGADCDPCVALKALAAAEAAVLISLMDAALERGMFAGAF